MALKVAIGIFRSKVNATEKCIFESRVIERFDDLCVVAESKGNCGEHFFLCKHHKK